jgi:hypothetical protein
MYRFVLTFFTYKITSSAFETLEECNNVFDNMHLKLNPCGGRIENKVLGIGWVIYDV